MASVKYNHAKDRYEVVRRGTLKSTHRSASAAKRAGKRLGRKFGEPVSYQGPRMNSPKFIHRPSASKQFSGGRHGTGR